MTLTLRKIFSIFVIFLIICHACESTPVNNSNKTSTGNINPNSSTTSYKELLNDVRWFFQRLEDFTTTAERLLPNVTLNRETRTFSEYSRLNFLVGLKHLLVGVKEISITVRKSFQAEHMRQLQYVIDAANIIHQALKALQIWFSNIRSLMGELFRIYNRHFPEVLLGKCLGKYIVAAYPERAFYEYPYLLFTDIFQTVVGPTVEAEVTASPMDEKENIEDVTTENISIEQNEIPNYTEEDYKLAIRGRALTENETDYMSFFNLSDVLGEDKNEDIDNVKHTWQKCFKMYTAETIVRKLKIYFLEED